jgi:hypothetical protein
MKRIVSGGIVLTALAVVAMSGQAAAFTPVPIPTPRIGSSAAATLMPISAPTHTSVVRGPVPCVGSCKPAAAFDHAGVLTVGGGAVRVSGPITCTGGDIVLIRATVSQGSTGAVAEGVWSKRCTGTALQWHITAIVTDAGHFAAGGADGVGLAIISSRGIPGTAVQWLRRLTLKAA